MATKPALSGRLDGLMQALRSEGALALSSGVRLVVGLSARCGSLVSCQSKPGGSTLASQRPAACRCRCSWM